MSKPSVLIVDDDRRLQKVISLILGPDFETLCVGSLFEAREVLRRRKIDVVVLDWMLRSETATELLDELADDSSSPAVLIVSGSSEAKTSAKRFGLRCIGKPFDVLDLLTAICSTLQRGQRPIRRSGGDARSRGSDE